uniref:NADH-ubiquinone oxidoreductase chain 3 n=3 Tax=Altica TaxID=131581 RepID=A0A4P8J9U4_9CUCU|nr:NADH dehydrogenase subunit 3 [Altica cirsicola]YP_009826209.1 NADH dehydrogenase subunit 3 [Altica viridicyanea]QCC71349.1 NADH dehydrogenase subunit 3 [Altica fragariae]QCC71323.1 NADH dehydrogenase subunit 3 [Altica cirsicola]QCC71362.1 NADH dehydrogenase subunit 3 [Altica viridicyanea]QCC71375.1 NADH dehydrogenase subunit 3 [Altica cirsicola]QCC71388.1 NADH dehydrogenase subunit 3 [Altica viridicyanea]
MFLILKLSTIIILIISVLVILLNLISKKSFYDREKNSPFECGFDPKTSSRLPFSLHFFIITVIFLIFDVEITLLFPLILTLKFTNLINYSFITLIFILILLIGIYHEWNQGALTWQK